MLAGRRPAVPQPRGLRLDFTALRRQLANAGLTPATSSVPLTSGSRDEVAFEEAVLVEGSRVEPRDVGAAESWPGTIAFLDGTQHLDLLGYSGTHPIIGAEVAAAVRERRDRDLVTVVERRRNLLIGRAAALERLAVEGADRIELSSSSDIPPLRDPSLASAEVDGARRALEVEAGTAYRERSGEWLVVDGSLAASVAWLRDARMVGISRWHSTMPFSGDDLDTYLRLPAGHRTPVFAPSARHGVEYRAWALRLWPWEGRELLHGLVRVEVAVANGTTERADEISRWLLAERAPIAATEPRWDTLIYPIHGVRQYLRARVQGRGSRV